MTAPMTPDTPASVVLRQFLGLNNRVARERLKPGELAEALDIDLDDTGQVRRRRGTTRVAAGSFHSLFEAQTGDIYVVRNRRLVRVLPDYSMVDLGQEVGNERLSYIQVGEVIYFSSRVASGAIQPNDTVAPWGMVSAAGQWLSHVVNPTPPLPEVRW